ncbi:hypothetical protein A4A28_07855, partial [Staphylococcus hominis]|uniref:SdpI family protein n=1 Tax=Staphylococcus hominis TaxID=1290 RepID=UPI0008FB454B
FLYNIKKEALQKHEKGSYQMLLFPSSIFMILLGNLIIKNPPKKINRFYGFRTKKSIKTQHNWDKGQIDS